MRLFGRDARSELDEELETHIAMRAEELERAGLDPSDARREATRRIGDRRRLYRSARVRDGRVRRRERIGSVWADIVLAVRRAANAPLATAVVVVTLALGIGLGTAGFTVTDRVLLRSLPFPDSDRLVVLQSVSASGSAFDQVAAASWREWRDGAPSLASTALYRARDYTLVANGSAVRVAGEAVTGEFFTTLQAPMHRGRSFTEAEVRDGARLAVASTALWRDALGEAALPVSVTVDGLPWQIIGVVAEGYEYPQRARLWVAQSPLLLTFGAAHTLINYGAIARIRDGVPRATVKAELDAVARRIRETFPEAIYSHGVGVEPLRENLVGDARRWLLLLTGGVGLVLLIVCANVAGLGLARGATRRQEMSVRVALGAGRGRLVRQLLTEQVVLACAGAVPGVLLAIAATRLIASRTAVFLPRAGEIRVDVPILAFAILLTVLTAVLSGLLPALRTSLAGLSGPRGSVGGGRRLPGSVLVAAEVALALMLVVGTALLVRSFQALLSRDLGFRTEGVVTAQVPLHDTRYPDAASQLAFWQRLEERLSAVPGVDGVAFSRWTPAVDGAKGFIDVEGRPDETLGAAYRVVSRDYFAVLAVPIVQGRAFDASDREGSPRVVLINEAMAREFWPDGTALGRQVRPKSMEPGQDWRTVVGVVRDYRHYGYDDPAEPEMYVPLAQAPLWAGESTVLVRGSDPAALAGTVARVIREENTDLAPRIATLERLVDDLVQQRRFVLRLLGGFAALSLVLAVVGLYGMLSFAVARQAREMGVRAALGARRSGLVRLVLARAARVLLAGAAVGVAGAAALSRTISAMLVDIAPGDPVSYVVATLVLLAAGLLAAFIPAWRAARADPLQALRSL